jgi:ATP-dependent RNA helicase RhlE
MLDMGFIGPVREIAAQIGSRRQTALFSATMAPEVAKLAASLLNEPVRVEASPQGTTVAEIDQRVILSGSKAKRGVLNELLADEALARVIIFSRTKHGADRVTKNLEFDGHKAAAIHGNKSQNARQAALKGFASGQTRILVATDIAARGIDVPGITHVINYELPDDAENYVHRIGRTGRNGASGFAITLCDSTERSKLRDVERLIRKTLPFTGDLHSANETGVVEQPRSAYARPAAGRPSQPRSQNGRPGQSRGAKPGQGRNPNAKPFAAFGDGKPLREAGIEGAGRPRRDGDKTFAGMPGSSKPSAPGKPRWDKNQKDASRARRSNDGRPRGERVTG